MTDVVCLYKIDRDNTYSGSTSSRSRLGYFSYFLPEICLPATIKFKVNHIVIKTIEFLKNKSFSSFGFVITFLTYYEIYFIKIIMSK